jgi:hypothetical protein
LVVEELEDLEALAVVVAEVEYALQLQQQEAVDL